MAETISLVAASDADAIAGGRHGDPFGVLGPHLARARTIIRTFQPHAARVWVTGSPVEVEMKRVHPDGLFAAVVEAGQTKTYRLRLELADGSTLEIDDPYRFPALLGDLDIHLLVEGKHLRTYEKMGAHVT